MSSGNVVARSVRSSLLRWIASTALLTMVATPAFAQYKVRHWNNFEDGKLPENVISFGLSPDQNLAVVDLETVQGMPPEFHKGVSAKETQKFAMRIKASPDPSNAKTYNNGLIAQQVVNRDELEQSGRALYQADFFIPLDGPLPSLAVLATEAPDLEGESAAKTMPNLNKPFYRFGMTKGKMLYFSLFVPGQDKAASFVSDQELLGQIPKPGWHRFTIVCEGPEDIRCYVDGREASFSPIKDGTLRKLMVGVMLADNERSYDAYVDNLSIQFSNEAPNLPASPYEEGWRIAAGGTKPGQTAAPAATPAPMPSIADSLWLDPVPAWQNAQSKKVPFLLYFFAPGIPGTQKMDEIFSTNKDAQEFLKSHSCTKIDVNTLNGGTIAQQYKIFKVPTLLIIAPDAQSSKQATLNKTDTWETLKSQLQ